MLNASIDIGKYCFFFLFGRRFEISLNIGEKNPQNAHHIIDIGESCFSFLFFFANLNHFLERRFETSLEPSPNKTSVRDLTPPSLFLNK